MPAVRLGATLQAGRFIASARDHHLVADATAVRGGPGESWAAAELLLAGLATCAAALVQSAAASDGVRNLQVAVHAQSEAHADESWRYERIGLEFGIEEAMAAQTHVWVGEFQRVCPIYNTLALGTRIEVAINGVPVR
ncbi:OsmC family protein [Xylophilus sp.]|uniref:OsmC family protein n=1 Tax=Xylophilus sp. TaxID=2653893 RepID=UPI0013BD9289|nr:OsmC family protein [Xylophilus sp.]KAF1047913.1 MAG: hypothetical protein GAK38_01623 [Xylophilus sp.]